MDELEKILAVSKAQAAAGTERIAFDPMALAHAIEAGIAANVAAERERCAQIVEHYNPGGSYHIRTALAAEIRRA